MGCPRHNKKALSDKGAALGAGAKGADGPGDIGVVLAVVNDLAVLQARHRPQWLLFGGKKAHSSGPQRKENGIRLMDSFGSFAGTENFGFTCLKGRKKRFPIDEIR